MPNQFLTLRFEYIHRESSVPYFAGHGGVTPPGGNTGAPGSFVAGWFPDLTNPPRFDRPCRSAASCAGVVRG
jgi:hypothetical protein